MEIKEIQSKEVWESFLGQCQKRTFLQSWNWGEFQKKMGNKIWRLGIFDGNNLTAATLISKISARRGTFLLIQHGPVFTESSTDKTAILAVLTDKLKELGKEEKAAFVRMNPLWENTQENLNILRGPGLKESPMHASAYEATWKLNISIPEEELLKNMRETTRYLIRRTQKNPDITVEKSENVKDIEIYQSLNKEVAKRQGFAPFASEYIKNEWETFLTDKQAALFFGKYKGEVVCGALVIYWSGIGFYHQAASLAKYAKLSIPYLVQWEAIKEAKNRGYAWYDFWGYTDPKKYPHHPWAGPTLFKMGFGGQPKEYLKTRDLPLSNKYWLTFALETARRIKRGL